MTATARKYRGAASAAGPLLTVRGTRRGALGEWVTIESPGQPARRGQVIEITRDATVVQVFEDTVGLAPAAAEIVLTGDI